MCFIDNNIKYITPNTPNTDNMSDKIVTDRNKQQHPPSNIWPIFHD